jgi:hypothetical protein
MQKLTANANPKPRRVANMSILLRSGCVGQRDWPIGGHTLNLTWIMGNTNYAIYRKLDLTFDKLMQATNSV